jgi:hypothetical protein
MFSFDRSKRKNDVEKLLRRVSDLTVPNQSPWDGDFRAEHRLNRSLPVLLVPWENGAARTDECATAVTKDISGQGLSLILRQPFRGQEVVIGFWLATLHESAPDSDPEFLLGEVRQNVEIGGGFWQIGVLLTERLAPSHKEIRRLAPIAARLVPPSGLSRVAPSEWLGE